jgi:1,4-alpha-glucan branching enzyme
MPPKRTAKANTVNVTFTLPAHVQAESVALCGDFNDWLAETIKLARNGDGTWHAIVPLERGRTYRYRYLLDGQRWENAWDAADYIPNPYGTEDSVVVVE